MNTETPKLPALAESLGFFLTLHGEPVAEYRDKDWLCISFDVSLMCNLASRDMEPRHVWRGKYSMGTACVKIPKGDVWKMYGPMAPGIPRNLTGDEQCALHTLQQKPSAQFKDKELIRSLYQKLATAQKVHPSLAEVVASLIMDGSPHFDSDSFPDWAGNCGYSDDSIKAKETYETCCDIGRKLSRALTPADLDALREASRDF